MSMYTDERGDRKLGKLVWHAFAVAMVLVIVAMAGCPQYSVYEQRLTGESELARAQQNRQIAVNEGLAKMEAAKYLAQAEVERAKGVAQANQIIAQGLKGNEEYLRYLWITDVAGKSQASVIYVPTEANLPILEASRHIAARAPTEPK